MVKQSKTSPTKRGHYAATTIAMKIWHVKEWTASGMKMDQYCKLHKLKTSTFSTWKKQVESKKITEQMPGIENKKRDVKGDYDALEKRLVQYIQLRNEHYQRDHCGLSWLYLREKAKVYANQMLSDEERVKFKASPGWLSNVLRRHDIVGVNLQGESGEVDPAKAEQAMAKFRKDLFNAMEKYGIDLSRVYNADQTGLFYQRLPNRIYCDKSKRNTIRGVKQMKDKARLFYFLQYHYISELHLCLFFISIHRITVMVCISATGKKVPLAIIGTSAKPVCFRLCENNEPPIKYTNQANAWFDKQITKWWLSNVLAPYLRRKHGDQKCILLMIFVYFNLILLIDNCPAHMDLPVESDFCPAKRLCTDFCPHF
jgi:hypothetical protein